MGCLDQSYFKDPQTGQDYILWKTDEIAFPIRTGVIYIQELQPSGTALLEGSVKQLMIEVDRWAAAVLNRAVNEPSRSRIYEYTNVDGLISKDP